LDKDLLYENHVEWIPYSKQQLSVAGADHIFIIDISSEFEKITDYNSVLSQQEIAKAARFFKQEDKQNYLVRRYALRMLLGAYLRQSPAEIRFHQSANRKPSLPGINFNTSHTSNFAVIALSESPIGIDIEKVHPDFQFSDLLNQCFSPEEITYVNSSSDVPMIFFTLWTRKEALLKATGEGIVDNLQQVSAMEVHTERNNFNYQLHSMHYDSTIVSIARSKNEAHMNYWRLNNIPSFYQTKR
jgi:4'-phosphopantetheinyl transferase